MQTARGEQPTIDRLEPRLITRFIRIDTIGAAGGIVFVAVINGLFVREAAVWIVVPFLAALVGALLIAAQVVDSNPAVALAALMVGNWIVAIAVSVLFPFLWPVMILTVLLPLVLATPYLRSGALGVAIAGSAIVGGVVAGAALLLDDAGVIEDIDDTAELVLVIGALAALIVPIALVVRQNNSLQRAALLEATNLNVELTRSERELLASRRRVVASADAERSRIERDLHDGAQQRLLALGMRLRLLESQTGHDAQVHTAVGELSGEVDAAIDELRALAHGIYPPLLEARGLADALTEVVRRSPTDVTLALGAVGRHDRGVESALYFTALEALSNAVKHGSGAGVRLSLTDRDDVLRLTVSDDGPGFVVADAGRSLGLLSMTDRTAALGGTLTIDSRPGAGTTVVAAIPLGDDGDDGR